MIKDFPIKKKKAYTASVCSGVISLFLYCEHLAPSFPLTRPTTRTPTPRGT